MITRNDKYIAIENDFLICTECGSIVADTRIESHNRYHERISEIEKELEKPVDYNDYN